MDDLNISRSDPKAEDSIIDLLQQEHGKEKDAPLTACHGKTHEHLGMKINFLTPGLVVLEIFDCIDKILEQMPAEFRGNPATPGAAHLFGVDADGNNLDKKTTDSFHHLMAMLSHICERSRPDLQTAVAFLHERAREPDQDDWKKLERTMKCLKATRWPPLTMSADANGITVIKWCVDASHDKHTDCKSHTGGAMSPGKGRPCSLSKTQKLNARSSTESELVGFDDLKPMVIWTRHFLEAQGHNVTANILCQDNKSTIFLEKNGKSSSGKRTKHVDICHFFVTDRVKNKKLTVEWCPAKEMLGDLFAKTMQGELFRKQRRGTMNLNKDDPSDHGLHGSQECVGSQEHAAVAEQTVGRQIARMARRRAATHAEVTGRGASRTYGKAKHHQN